MTAKKSPTVAEELEQLKDADWKGIASEGVNVIAAATAATGKEHTMTAKIIAFLKHIKDNTGIDEALLEFSRCFLLVSISCALGLGVPLLQIDGPNMSIVLSAGLASGLQVLVKYLDPKQTAFGIKEKK